MWVENFLLKDNFDIEIRFGDGFCGRINLAEWAKQNGVADCFAQAVNNGLTIEWPGEVDICPDTLRLWCEVGKVLPEKETQSYFNDLMFEPSPRVAEE